MAGGRLGRKAAKGLYRYEGGKKGEVDSSVYSLLKVSPDNQLAAQNIAERCTLLFVNESVRCLEEGVLAKAYDGDIAAVFGLGFPPFWGGPFKYVDFQGARQVTELLHNLAKTYGERFEPAPLLEKMASANERFFPEERT
jgi:3-hydroxyacyl-CoA dehydrogenase/enoyl-CoA hydratase/3-hydroxybutyryl-CoA epimerase